MNKYFIIITLLIFVLINNALSVDMTDKNGSVGAQFLKIGIGARASAMGNAFVALSDDISAIYYNPGGLTNLRSAQSMFTMMNLPADMKYQFGSVALPISELRGVIGLYFANLNSGDMKVTTPMRPFGTGENFCVSNIAVGIAYATALTDRFSFGMTMKYIALHAYGYRTHTIGFDIGTMYDTGFKSFRIGARMANFGPDMKYIDETFPMPVMMEIGGAVDLLESRDFKLTTSFQAGRINDSFENYVLGFESQLLTVMFIRTGYRWLSDSEKFSVGMGLNIPIGTHGIKLDYSYTDMHYLNNYQRFSLILIL